MPVTSPDNIYFSDTSAPADVNAISSSEATSVQAALALRQRYEFVWANAAARTAQTGMTGGSTGYQVDTKTEYIYESSVWRLKTPYAEFSSSASVPVTSAGAALGLPAIDSSLSTSATFVTPTAGGSSTTSFNFVDPGIYSISTFSLLTASASSLTFMQVSTAAGNNDSGRLIRGIAGPGDDTLSMAFPSYRISAANTPLYFGIYQATGATRTIVTRYRIARIG